MSDNSKLHQPVLLKEVESYLAVKPAGTYIDGTYGRGGHSEMIMRHLGKDGHLLAIDKDLEAIAAAKVRWQGDDRFCMKHGSFAMIGKFCEQQSITEVDGIFLDLGMSSPQVDNPERGFSFSNDGPLDMRMDTSGGVDAATWINSVEEAELIHVLRTYGEERYAQRIAHAIIEARAEQPFTRTAQLAEVVKSAHPRWKKHKHPATCTFQAIRIAINHELDDLTAVLDESLDRLAIGGRLVVISFHSLEDRCVKKFMKKHSQSDDYPIDLPIRAADLPLPRLKLVSRAVKAGDNELADNWRARSAVLRVAERVS